MKLDEAKIEDLDADDAKLVQMLSGLKRVEAPANFEFRLKGRLAKAERPRASTSLVPAFVRYAAPLTIIALIATLYFVSIPNSPDNGAVQTARLAPPVSVVSEPVVPAATVDQPDFEKEATAVKAATAARPKPPVLRKPSERRIPAVKSPERIVSGQDGSTVRAVSPAKIILPEGINPENPANAPAFGSKISFAARQVLPMLGINAGFGKSGWRVKSVKSNSAAQRAGVQAGDIVEAIGGDPLVKGAVFSGGFTGKALRVRRAGKVVELTLQNK